MDESIIHESWMEAIGEEFEKEYYIKLKEFIEKERDDHAVFPPPEQVFAALELPLDEVRVVICGQDCYHGYGQAHGLCFSVANDKQPPSLKNMFKELVADPDVEFVAPHFNGNLTPWRDQGVLLLNSCLTVSMGKANSHAGQGWEQFTDAVINAVNERCKKVVFLLWGNPAQEKCKRINKSQHTILKAPHPSPLSAHRGFFGCSHFSLCNAALEKAGKKPIDWQI